MNNYNGYSNDSSPLFQNASDVYSTFHGQANYGSNLLDVNGRPANYFEFQYGDVAFFVLDTRRYFQIWTFIFVTNGSSLPYRYRSIVGIPEGQTPTMLGEKQFADFHRWIAKVNTPALPLREYIYNICMSGELHCRVQIRRVVCPAFSNVGRI